MTPRDQVQFASRDRKSTADMVFPPKSPPNIKLERQEALRKRRLIREPDVLAPCTRCDRPPSTSPCSVFRRCVCGARVRGTLSPLPLRRRRTPEMLQPWPRSPLTANRPHRQTQPKIRVPSSRAPRKTYSSAAFRHALTWEEGGGGRNRTRTHCMGAYHYPVYHRPPPNMFTTMSRVDRPPITSSGSAQAKRNYSIQFSFPYGFGRRHIFGWDSNREPLTREPNVVPIPRVTTRG